MQDGSCIGIQLFSVMLQDQIGQVCSLPEDIYKETCKRVLDRLQRNEKVIEIYSSSADMLIGAYCTRYTMQDTSMVNQIIRHHADAGKWVTYNGMCYGPKSAELYPVC